MTPDISRDPTCAQTCAVIYRFAAARHPAFHEFAIDFKQPEFAIPPPAIRARHKNMKTVRDACKLQPNALSIKLSDQIEQLDELITAEGDGAAFFEKTHITQGMQDLITEGIARLAGASSPGRLSPQAGHGRRQDPPARRLRPARQASGASQDILWRDAACLGFRDRRHRRLQRPQQPDHFFWGEIANQLGKGEQFKAFWTGGPKAPDEKDWLKLFDGDRADPHPAR